MKPNRLILTFLAVVIIASLFWLTRSIIQPDLEFDGELAYNLVQQQVEFGPRIPGSNGHRDFSQWAQEQFHKNGWSVQTQQAVMMDHEISNILAQKGKDGPLVVLGAHYDTRMVADQDPEYPDQPVPGANDGASGVAVLLELSRTLKIPDDLQVWLVLFDAEDQGRLEGWDWILGSTVFSDELTIHPAAVVVVDMVGDADLSLKFEQNSTPKLKKEIWSIAKKLGYGDVFIAEPGFSMLDDHTPFLNKEIPAVDIIDFDYPFWHTIQDTPDKVSAESLQMVGRTLETWLEGYPEFVK